MKLFLTLLLCLSISIALSENTLGQQTVAQIKSSNDTSAAKLKKTTKKLSKPKSPVKKPNAKEMKSTPKQQEEMEFRRSLLLKENRNDTMRVK
jgi:hypothetical protein